MVRHFFGTSSALFPKPMSSRNEGGNSSYWFCDERVSSQRTPLWIVVVFFLQVSPSNFARLIVGGEFVLGMMLGGHFLPETTDRTQPIQGLFPGLLLCVFGHPFPTASAFLS